jgi:hypothetical protein
LTPLSLADPVDAIAAAEKSAARDIDNLGMDESLKLKDVEDHEHALESMPHV